MECSKRSFLKASGATAATALAGCLGSSAEHAFWAGWWDESHYDAFREWYDDEVEAVTDETWELTEYQYDDLQNNVITGGNTGTPDVFEGTVEQPSDYVAADILEPMTDHVDAFNHADGFVDTAIDALTFNGELWGVPVADANARALVYRTDVLEEYGYEDGPPSDAEEFVELAAEINANEEMNGLHMTTERGEVRVTQEFLSHVYQHADGMFVESGDGWELNPDVDADVFEAILETFYYNLFLGDNPVADDSYRGSGWETNDEGYSNGEHAMVHCGPWIAANTGSDQQEEIMTELTAVAPLPSLDGAEERTFMEVAPVMVNAHGDDVEAALDAVELFTSPEAGQMMLDAHPSPGVPTHDELETVFEVEAYEAFDDIFETGIAPAPIQWGQVRDPIYDAIEEVIYGETEPRTAAEALEEAILDLDPSLSVEP